MQVLQRPYDDPADTSTEFWLKCPTNKSVLGQNKSFESLLALKRKYNKKEWKFRTCRLTEDMLICFSRKNLHQIKYIEFDKIICTIDTAKEKDTEFPYGLTLIYNGKTMIFRSKEEDAINGWLKALTLHCVFLDFEKKYKLMNKVGSGGYAKVYLTEHLATNTEYAAKMINFPKQDKSKDKKKHRDMILNEIVALKKLDHPNIVKIKELFCVHGELCIVMELIKGKKMIEDLKERGRYSERKTAILAKQLLLTLSYVHEKKIIHRDLKPENLLLVQDDDNMEVKLLDFGLAAFIGMSYQGFKKCGTAGFIAPEIFRDEPFSDQIDVFSLGVILYVCLCGKPPFKGKNYYDLLKKNYLCEYKFNFKYWHTVSEEAKNLVSRMMDPYPNSRITIKEALNHEWFKNALKLDVTRGRSGTKKLSTGLNAELLKPSVKEANSNNNSQLESVQVPDLTQKLKSLIFSSPNLSGNKERLIKAKVPSFYMLSQVVSPSSRSINELEKLDKAEKRDDDFLKTANQSNLDLNTQGSFMLKAVPSNYDSPYQINIMACKNIEDITDEDADDNAEDLQQLMKQFKNNQLRIRKPFDTLPPKLIATSKSHQPSTNGAIASPGKRKRDHSKSHHSTSKKDDNNLRKSKDEDAAQKSDISKVKGKA